MSPTGAEVVTREALKAREWRIGYGTSARPRRALEGGRRMTTLSIPLTVTNWELARRSSIRAFRAGRYVLILAEGELPTPGYEVDIEIDRARVFPARYDLIWRER